MKKLHSSYLYTKIAFKNQVRQRKKEMKKKIKFNLSKVYGILFSTFTAHRTLPSTPTFSNRLTWSKWEILANFFLSHFLPYNGHHCFDFRSKKKSDLKHHCARLNAMMATSKNNRNSEMDRQLFRHGTSFSRKPSLKQTNTLNIHCNVNELLPKPKDHLWSKSPRSVTGKTRL